MAHLERGDAGVAIGTLADVMVVLGLVERLAELIDIRKDDLGLALVAQRQPRRDRSSAVTLRRQQARQAAQIAGADSVNPEGVAL